MAKITYSSLGLKINNDTKKIIINGKEIEVKQYLPAEDKNSLLENVMNVADTATVINTLAVDIVFHVYLVIKYTNIIFTDKQKEDVFKLYDELDTNGIIDKVVEAIPEDEYYTLYSNLEEMVDLYKEYRNSARGFFEKFDAILPNIGNLDENLKNIDMEKFQNVVSIAQAVGINNNNNN